MPREREERTAPAAETRERERPAALASAPARILALQQAAGNRAVVRALARTETATTGTVSSTTDPRLHYRGEGEADTPGLDTERLPFTNPSDGLAGWDAVAILNRLTQHDEEDFTFSDEVRCGANAALAVAIMAGPRQTAAFARRVAQRASGRMGMPTVGRHGMTDAQRERMDRALDNLGAAMSAEFAATNIGLGWASYSDLNGIAHAAKVAMTRNSRGFSFGTEVVDMVRGAGATTRVGRQVRSREAFTRELGNLRAGDAYIVHVDTDVLAHGTTTTSTQGNHFVTVGRLPGGGDAQYYLYDPFPRTGDQFVMSTNAEFWTIFENTEGDWKWVYIESLTRAPAAGGRR